MPEFLEYLWSRILPHSWQDWAVYVVIGLALAFACWCAWSIWADRGDRNFWV